MNDNPLLSPFEGNYGTPPYGQIQTAHFEPAFRFAIASKAAEINGIADDPSEPDFENTIERLERSGALLEQVSALFYNLLESNATDELMEISERVAPLLTKSTNDVYLNRHLFSRVKAVYEARTRLTLTPEEKRLLEETYAAFIRRGAGLDEVGKARYEALTAELDLLMLRFDRNVLKGKEQFRLHLTKEEELAGLSPRLLALAHERATEAGMEGWLFDLTAPSYVPFMKESERRDLREAMYRAYMGVGAQAGDTDNRAIVRRVADLRRELAQLLGYRDFASYELEHTMAHDKQQVHRLLSDLLRAYLPAARKECEEMKRFMQEREGTDTCLMPWDWSFYSERLRKQLYGVADEQVRPYFELGNLVRQADRLAGRLFGISFATAEGVATYAPGVEVRCVYDADNRLLGLLYADYYSRTGKQPGAWMSEIRTGCTDKAGRRQLPLVSVTMNFAPPAGGEPALLSFDEASTYLHEFGHALHALFSECKYAGLAGTNVCRDFVELPSQLLESWLTERRFLGDAAVHYRTGAPMPEEMLKQLTGSVNFHAGYQCCRQVGFALLDMALHSLERPLEGELEAFERDVCREAAVLPPVEGALLLGSFSHILSGGYAAGYYGYKWAEVLAADAFERFKEEGLFSREVADSLRENILSKGNSEDPQTLYLRFRKRLPTVDALLRRNGLEK